MKALTIEAVTQAVDGSPQGETDPQTLVTNVVFDARLATKGSLFVPLKGTTDGHHYVQQAVDNGAVATLWSQPKESAPTQIAVIHVQDTLQALHALARYYLHLIQPKVIGITGSSGKTTTKDMTAAVLGVAYRVHKTAGNYNNEIGVPMTILAMPEDTEVLVLEMGMSGFGEIAELTHLAKPEIAVITMIGEDHLEQLGSQANIAKAKMEILEGLRDHGTFIYPGEEPLIKAELDSHPIEARTISIGLGEDQDLYAFDITSDAYQTTFKTNLSPEVVVTLPVMGAYNVLNALDACAVAYAYGLSIEQITDALAHFQLTENRTAWVKGLNGSDILNDTYNASPSAMKAVLNHFKQIARKGDQLQGRKRYVLGDMLELGEDSEALHRSLASVISLQKQDDIWLYGEQMRALAEILLEREQADAHQIHYYPHNQEALIQDLRETLSPHDQILIKGSHGMHLIDVVHGLQ